MSAPRTKRQFAGAASDPAQRQIKEFFQPASSSSTSTPTDYASGPLSPPLPPAVQANLISVGMRVRKSVADGHKTRGVFLLYADNTIPGHQQQQQQQQQRSSDDFGHTSQAPPSASASLRELLPFCGINKVGGLAVQPEAPPIPASFFTSSAMDKPSISITPVPDLSDLPGLTSSQDSVLSTSSSPPYRASYSSRNAKKRTYAAHETVAAATLSLPGDDIIWRNRRDWIDGEVSPRSLAPAGWEKNARVMAVPRGAARKQAAAAAAAPLAPRDPDQENRVVRFAVAGEADDFEEAEFLDYMEVEEE